MQGRVLASLAVLVVMAGCDAAPSPGPSEAAFVAAERPPLHVFNNTTVPVVVTVNGQRIGQVGPNDASDVDVDRLPPVPWLVEARTMSGRLLVSISVGPGDVGQHRNGDGSTTIQDVSGMADLSCGRLVLFAGAIRPGAAGGAPPAQPAGKPGDCA